jgi:hypothetical protein
MTEGEGAAGGAELPERLEALEGRLQSLEDQVALYQLMSAYGPLVDSGDADATADLWIEDGVYDWGAGPRTQDGDVSVKEGSAGGAYGRAAIAQMVRGPYHQAIIDGGAGHVTGLPHIVLSGDTAVAISYSRLYRRDGDNFRVWRVAANRWAFVRTAEGWRVKTRINRVLDGGEEARTLLRTGIMTEGADGV